MSNLAVKILFLMCISVALVHSGRVVRSTPYFPEPAQEPKAEIPNKRQFEIEFNQLSTNVEAIYAKIQSFFNSIFQKSNVELTYSSLKTLSGAVTHNNGDQVLVGTHILTTTIQDISFADGPAKILAQTVNIFPDSSRFPLNFAVSINEKLFSPDGRYSLSVTIEKDGKLMYINDYIVPVTDDNGKLIAYPILVNVISTGITTGSGQSSTNTLTGSIILKSADPMALFSIEENSLLEVTVSDTSRMDAKAIILGQYQTLLTSQRFPIKYSVNYDKQPLSNFPGGTYTISVRIMKDGRLVFTNDEQHLVTDPATGTALSTVDVKVIPTNVVLNIPGTVPVPVPVTQQAPALKALIKGRVVSQGVPNDTGDQTLVVTIRDVSLQDAPSVVLAKQTIPLRWPWSFPVDYQIELDTKEIIENPWRSFSVSARITRNSNERLTYISDTRIDLVDQETMTIRSDIEVPVIVV